MLAQVLLVTDLEPGVVHQRNQQARPCQLTVGEHVPVDEAAAADRRLMVVRPRDAVVEQTAARLQLPEQEREVPRQLGPADVLGQPD